MILAVGILAAAAPIIAMRGAEEANAETAPEIRKATRGEVGRLRDSLEAMRGELDLAAMQLQRAQAVIRYSTRYRIAADLAGDIFDVSQAEGIEPELAFRLVKLESNFNERATSPVGAIGLTQLMMNTAVGYQKKITKEKLYDRHTNLRIGFRHLRGLLKRYDDNVNIALLVYNRGAGAVARSRRDGRDPSNGYDRILMRNYSGKVIVH